jgi:hypothetical protein
MLKAIINKLFSRQIKSSCPVVSISFILKNDVASNPKKIESIQTGTKFHIHHL